MFGLMRAKKCGMSEDEKHFRRLNYCGTCKTIGALYSQKARFLLNHDTVFLAEMLAALGGETARHWPSAYQSYNCLSVPKSDLPPALQFAATTNVILTEFKLADAIADENRRRHKIAGKTFSKDFRKAEKILREWNFPLDRVKALLETQVERETTELSGQTLEEKLENFAAPTAETTALFFGEGVRQTGNKESYDAAYRIGFSFGKIIYLVDAFEDFEKDFRRGQFNALRAAFDLKTEILAPEIRRKAVAIVKNLETEIAAAIHELPIPENQKALFVSRLAQNLQRKLKTNLPVLKAKKQISCAPKPKTDFKTRWNSAAQKAHTMAGGFSWQMPLVFLFIFVFALAAPAQSREAKSARECFDLSFNLMFLGALLTAGVGAVLALPKAVWARSPEEIAAEEARKKAEQGGGDVSAEGCCDTCDCCCCTCESCGEGDCACGGCCDNCGCGGCCDNCNCDGCCCDCSCD